MYLSKKKRKEKKKKQPRGEGSCMFFKIGNYLGDKTLTLVPLTGNSNFFFSSTVKLHPQMRLCATSFSGDVT